MTAEFTFIDLFAGIGGIRRGFESIGGSCVFTSEWDKFAVATYQANNVVEHPLVGDITQVEAREIPDHDVLLGGFPCQPFSIAGVSKKASLGRAHGFEDKTQGTLFFDIARIIEVKRPRAFLLENVKNIYSHDKGRTFSTILSVLEEDLGYHVRPHLVSSSPFVPQRRERVLIAGFAESTSFSWDRFENPLGAPPLSSILHPEDGSEIAENPYTEGARAKVAEKYTLTPRLWEYLQEYKRKHRQAGNGFGFGLVGPDDQARTLSARYYKDGAEILIDRGPGRVPRRLTPREAARLMGYADDFVLPTSDMRAYKQMGNSVVVPVIAEAARIMKPYIVSDAYRTATAA